MGYRTRRKSRGYSTSNKKSQKEKISEQFESFIGLPAHKIDITISKEQKLIDTLNNNLRELEAFSNEISSMQKDRRELAQRKSKIDSVLSYYQSELKKFDDYNNSGILGRIIKSKPVSGASYYNTKRQELIKDELESKNLADKLVYLDSILGNKQITIEGEIFTSTDYYKKQRSVIARKDNAELRLHALLQAKSHVQSKETSIQEREEIAAREVGKYKAFAAAYFDESRKLADSVKKEMRGQEMLVNGCPYCGLQLDDTPHADHIYPIIKGGLSVKENMVYVCNKCNLKKSGMTLREFIIKAGLNRVFVEENLEKLGKTF